jgi:raffinose/stachyose/melibiose transport system substrate-binding protein
VTALDYFQQMLDAGCFNDDSTGLNNDGMLQMTAKGEALGTMPNALQLSALRTLAGDAVDIVYAPLSGGEDAATSLIAATSSGGAAVYSKARNKALDFVDFMASTAGTEVFVNAMNGPVPAIPNSEIELGPAALTEITAFLEEDRTVPFLNQNWPNARIEQAMFSGLQGMITGANSGADVLEMMDAEHSR